MRSYLWYNCRMFEPGGGDMFLAIVESLEKSHSILDYGCRLICVQLENTLICINHVRGVLSTWQLLQKLR